MGKNSRQWRWKFRDVDLAMRFKKRLKILGFSSEVSYLGEVIPPKNLTASRVFEIQTDAPPETIKMIIIDPTVMVCNPSKNIYQVWV